MKVLPVNVLPYEKLELFGEESLNLEELLAIILKTGIKNKNAMQIAKEIMDLGENGNSLRFLQDVSLLDLIKIEGIDKIFLSSTMIRDKIKNGENVEEFINTDVLEYIKNNK